MRPGVVGHRDQDVSAMPTTQATLTTRASRYLTQLGNHAAAMAGVRAVRKHPPPAGPDPRQTRSFNLV